MKIIKKQTLLLATTLILAVLLCGAVSAEDGNSVSDPTLATPDTTPKSTDQVQVAAAGDPTGLVVYTENYKLVPEEKVLYNAQVNEETSFSTWVLNYGSTKATGIYVIETIPDGLEYINHYTSVGNYDHTTGIWTLPDMDGQPSWDWQTDTYPNMFIQVKAIKAGTYTNTATIYSQNYPTVNDVSTLIVGNAPTDNTAPTVKATPAAGSYYSPQNVALAASETSNIFYTTDGSVPTKTSTAYATPINIATSKTLKFTAWDPANNQSPVYIAQYLIYKSVTSSYTVKVPYQGWYKYWYKKWYKKWYRSHGKWKRHWTYKWRYKWKYSWLYKNVVRYSSKYVLT